MRQVSCCARGDSSAGGSVAAAHTFPVLGVPWQTGREMDDFDQFLGKMMEDVKNVFSELSRIIKNHEESTSKMGIQPMGVEQAALQM